MTSLNKAMSASFHFLRLHVATGGHGVFADVVGKIVGVNMSAGVESACELTLDVMGCTTPLRTKAIHFVLICLRVIWCLSRTSFVCRRAVAFARYLPVVSMPHCT